MTEQPKTMKREVACVMLLFLGIMHTAGVFYPAAVQTAEYITTPIFLFAGGAFGMDAFSKQVTK